jgi:hypothetical protein
MAHKVYIGIDNGTTGTIGWAGDDVGHPEMVLTPTMVEQSYTKKAQNMTRVDHVKLKELLERLVGTHETYEVMVVMERPMTNNAFAKAVVSSARTFEATRIIVEQMKLPYTVIDSKDWQKVLLPTGIKGSDERKRASMDIGLRLFPDQEKIIRKHKDADGLLIAEWARRVKL